MSGTGISACMFNELLVSEQSDPEYCLAIRETQWNEPYYGFPWLRRNHCPMILVVSTCNGKGIARVRPLAGFRY